MAAVGQPSGRVTFVFTDIEGSTALLESLGPDAYRAALAVHRDVVRDAFGRHAGYEVNYEGDAFFYAFASAPDAIAAVGRAMRALESGPIRVRVGVHTGEPVLDPPKYVGIDVHRAARIMSAAHGGQVVLSHETARELPPRAGALIDLGEHRLKDLDGAQRLYQLELDGLARAFPPLRSLYRAVLPVAATPIRGRTTEVARSVRMLTDPSSRLVTLTGPGGVGKTRLALQAAMDVVDAYADGVTWVPLAHVRAGVEVPRSVARALEVAEAPGRPVTERIVRSLTDTRRLLVLDNCEHVLDAVAPLARSILDECPRVTLLATTREPLALLHERVLRVPPLPATEAEALFVERARAVRDDFDADEHVPAICAALDGLPLAIELAAARVRSLSTGAILERLGTPLPLLIVGMRHGDDRHRSLENTIGWSYDLLDLEEQRVLRQLGVFVGGCTLEAVLSVCRTDLHVLESLVDKSLVSHRVDEAGQDRYDLLQIVREFALARLGPEEADAAYTRHAAYYVALAQELEPDRFGAFDDIERVDADDANFRAALEHAVSREDTHSALRVVRSLCDYWYGFHGAEGAFETGVRVLRLRGGDPGDRAHAQVKLACMAGDLGRLDEAHALWDAAERRLAETGDLRGVWRVLNDRSFFEVWDGRGVPEASHALDVARVIGDPSLQAISGLVLSMALEDEARRSSPLDVSQLAAARSLEASAMEWFTTSGTTHDRYVAYTGLSFRHLLSGELGDALDLAQRSIRAQGGRARKFAWRDILNAAFIASRAGWHERSAVLLAVGVREYERVTESPAAWDEPLIEDARSAARAALGDEAYARATARGEAMEALDAVEIVLGLSPAALWDASPNAAHAATR